MKNIKKVRVHLTGDVFACYDLSAEPLAEGEFPPCTIEFISPDKFTEMSDELCFPDRNIPVVDKVRGRAFRNHPYNFFVSGKRTREGVVSAVRILSEYLADYAQAVWDNIDPRCGAKIPSRLYRNVAHICADALTHLGVPAHVAMLALDPAAHNGLKNQYRVVVDAKVPVYPWKEECTPDEKNPNKTYHRLIPVYENLNFDFDVTNALRVQWVWPGSPRVLGEDVRVLRNGRPVRWVDSLGHLTREGYSHFTVMRGSQTPIEAQADGELLLKQTSLVSVLAAVSDGTSEGMVAALNKMFNSPTTKSTAKSAITQMNLG